MARSRYDTERRPAPRTARPAPTTEALAAEESTEVRFARALGILLGDDYGPSPEDYEAPETLGAPEQPGGELLTEGLDEMPDQSYRQTKEGELGGDNLQSGSFAHDLLASLNLPVTFENVRAINAWQKAETGGPKKPAFNPLATTQNFGSWTKFNTFGPNGEYSVKNYADYDTGVRATANVLVNGKYDAILTAFARGNDAMAVARAIEASPWGTGGGVVRVLGG